MRGRLSLLLALAVGAGCQTPVGRYFANRARDLGECVRVEAGFGVGLGVGVHAVGVAHVGLGGGFYSPATQLGWCYGEPRWIEKLFDPEAKDPICFDGWLPFMHAEAHGVLLGRPAAAHDFHLCYGWLPAVFSRIETKDGGRSWLWEPGTTPQRTRARIHAFDVEVIAFAGVARVAVGFSPGEFLDFVTGWFGADIAGDDASFAPTVAKDG